MIKPAVGVAVMTESVTRSISCRDANGDIVDVLAVADDRGREIRYFYEDRDGASWLLAKQQDGSFIDALNDRQFWPIIVDSSKPRLVVGIRDMTARMSVAPANFTSALLYRRRRYR